MAEQTPTQRKATAKKAAATRKRNAAARGAKSTRRSAKATQASARTATANATSAGSSLTLDSVALQAERAVLIPVGAALIARDKVVEAAKSYTSRATAEKELRRFERRGTTARNSVRREVKRTRTRVERELRQRRSAFEDRVGGVGGDVRKQVSEVQANATELARKVQEQVAALA